MSARKDAPAPSGGPLLELAGVSAERGGVEVVHEADLVVSPGEVLCLLGPNGSGKSTLLEVAGGLAAPVAGRVVFAGREVRGAAQRAALRREAAAVFQSPLPLDRSVLANVMAGQRFRGVGRAVARERARAWLERLRVGHLAERRATKLSGGEAQRVSLARAFVVEPRLLLLDEPLASLDAPTADALLDDLAGLVHSERMAVIYVTHQRAEALRLADRVAVMMDGRVRQTGTPEEIFGGPADAELASFVGVENVLAGSASAGPQGTVVRVDGSTLELVTGDACDGPVLACFRPEELVFLGDGGTTSMRNVVDAAVVAVTPAGPVRRIELETAGVRLVGYATSGAVDELAIASGAAVRVGVKATAIHLVPRSEAPAAQDGTDSGARP